MTGRRVLILGAGGQLGRQLVTAFEARSDTVLGWDHRTFDLLDPQGPTRLIAASPDVVVNAAAWTDVDGCAGDPQRAMELNGLAPGRLAAAANQANARFVQISTNEVFDGTRDEAYTEADIPRPLNPYGASKLAGESAVARSSADNLVIRTAWIFGPGGRNFVSRIIGAALQARGAGAPLRVVCDEWGNPTWAPDLAAAIEQALRAGARGVLHIAGEPPATRHQWAMEAIAGLHGLTVLPIDASAYPRPAPAPRRAVLSTLKAQGLGIPKLEWPEWTRQYAEQLLVETEG